MSQIVSQLWQRRLGIGFAVFSTFFLSACSLLSPSAKTVGASEMPIEATAGANPDVTPFILEVVSEKNDGEKLSVKGRIIPKTTRPASEVVVRLSALDKRGKLHLVDRNMQELLNEGAAPAPTGKLIKSGVAQTFSLSIPVKGVTNYQLEVLWGSGFSQAASKEQSAVASEAAPSEDPQPFIALRDLEVHRVPTESCSSPDECIVRFTITGELFNAGRATIRDVVIEAGFATGENLDLRGQILENEKRVEVPDLRLKPGGARRFKVTLEKLVPSSSLVAPQPIVRIASFRSE